MPNPGVGGLVTVASAINKEGFYGKMILETQPLYETCTIHKRVCPNCQSLQNENSNFCGICGHPLNTVYDVAPYASMCRPKYIHKGHKGCVSKWVMIVIFTACLVGCCFMPLDFIIAYIGSIFAIAAFLIYFLTAPLKVNAHYKEVMTTSTIYNGVVLDVTKGYRITEKGEEKECAAKAIIRVDAPQPFVAIVYYAETIYTDPIPMPQHAGEKVNVYIYKDALIFTLPPDYK